MLHETFEKAVKTLAKQAVDEKINLPELDSGLTVVSVIYVVHAPITDRQNFESAIEHLRGDGAVPLVLSLPTATRALRQEF